MGSVKFKDLKAYVRYDGSGRVVAGSLVFRKKKPKNGRWMEISSNLCCNANPSSTTTTTTSGGGVTPTAFVKGYWLSEFDSCNTTIAGSLVFYSASSTISAGVAIFQDAALTIPVTQGYVVMGNDPMANPFLVGAGGVLSVRECPPPIIYNNYEASRFTVYLCPPETGTTLNIGVPGGDIATASIIYCTFIPNFTANDTIYVKFLDGGIYYTRQFITNNDATSATPLGSPVAC